MNEPSTNSTLKAAQRVNETETSEVVSYAPTKPQADITKLTGERLASEKKRPNVQVQKMLDFHEKQIVEIQEKLDTAEAQRAVELELEKSSYNEWRERQEDQINALRSAMASRSIEFDTAVKGINSRADEDVSGYRRLIVKSKSFLSAE